MSGEKKKKDKKGCWLWPVAHWVVREQICSLENRFEVLMNEESPNVINTIEHRLNQPVANTAYWRPRLSRQRHSAQSTGLW